MADYSAAADRTRDLFCLIGGSRSGKGPEHPVTNPARPGETVALCRTATADEVDVAIAAARAALPACRAMGVQARADALEAVATEIFRRKNELARLLTREEGKTLAEATAEVTRAGYIFRFFAGEAVRLQGEWGQSVRPGITVEIQREPVGVIGIVTPWNFPIAIPAWKAAPALAFGNAVVMKPAELAPVTAHALGEIILRAGFPEGAFNLVLGSGSIVGQRIVESGGVDAVSFTGSQSVGARIAAACAERGARYQLEMGGKNPLIVLNDADIDLAVEAAVNGAFYSTGQRCTASSRLIVEAGIHDVFVEEMRARLASTTVGDPLDGATHIGPVIDERQLAKNLDYVALGQGEGCELVFGGERRTDPFGGFFQSPALLIRAGNGMRVCREEIFGPVAAVIEARDYEEALHHANDTPYGLSAGIMTRSHKHAAHFKQHSKSGLAMVNLPTAGLDYHVPFGGVAASSFGAREQGTYAREFFTITKTAYDLAV